MTHTLEHMLTTLLKTVEAIVTIMAEKSLQGAADELHLRVYSIWSPIQYYSHLPKVLDQTQIFTRISSHLSPYHRKCTLNEVSIR